MSVSDNFKAFCNKIKIQNRSTISTRYSNITKRLNTDFWSTTSETAHSLYVGSFGRNTGIDGISDVDMLFQLPTSLYTKYDNYESNGQSALLQAVKTSIAKTYSGTSLAADGQIILVSFGDKPVIEVLPAFINANGISYTYADSNNGGSWKTTNPKAEIDAMRNRDANCNKNLKRLCRMMRVWKQYTGAPITGFLVDTLAYQFINTWAHKDKSYLYYDFMVRDFLKFLSERDEEQKYWTAPGSSQYVYRTGKFESYAKSSYETALKAIAFEDDKKPLSANAEWKKIFGYRYDG